MEQRVNNLTEKLASLATEVAVVQAKQDLAEESREEIKERQEEINRKLEELINKVTRWEGKFGGVLFILGCLGAFFSGLLTFIKNWVTTFGVPGK
jgi:hypothetical protein